MLVIIRYVDQECTNPGRQVARATKFCMVELNCGSSVWILLHVNLLAPRNLRWLLDFWKTCGPLMLTEYVGNGL